MDKTGNPRAKFMCFLPASHDNKTIVGRRSRSTPGSSEITDEVFESARSIVFDQAENRLRTIKAVLVATIGGA